MKCQNCQTDNPEGAKFCYNCGQKMALQCPVCSTELPAGAKFCFNCGHNMAGASAAPEQAPQPEPEPAAVETSLERFIPSGLLAKLENARATGAMAGERRIVTMMFCDIQGSTAAAGQFDPEDWAEIVNGAFEYMIKPVYKFEGTIARLMGDAILAFFGAPIAHEDDAERAVRTGLEIIEAIKPYRQKILQDWGLDFNVRVGINTGLVVVGAVGSDLRMEYTALGDAINLAARMEQTAKPGTVQIAEDTHKHIAPLFDFEDLGGIEVKGKDKPVQAYRVLEAKLEPGRLRGIAGLESPLVGRDVEMHTLRGAIIGLRQGHGSILSLIGEAGLGKSRLIAELRREPLPVPGRSLKLHWAEGRSFSYETNTPYAPFVDLMYDCFHLERSQGEAQKYVSIKTQVEDLMPGQGEAIAPFIASMMDITPQGSDNERVKYLDPPMLRGNIFQAVSRFIENLANREPLVLVFDDVHWIDPTSLELLMSLLPLADRVPVLILALFRPRRSEPSWELHETAGRKFAHRYQYVLLQPLDEGSSRELVANLLHVEGLPESVRRLILEKAEGNPFYVEEVIRSLIDAGLIYQDGDAWRARQEISNIAVPDTLAAVITTRLDSLGESSKNVVQTASIIGREFEYDILVQVYPTPVDIPLDQLQRRELVREKSRIPERIYSFKHALTQETAYESILLKNRRDLHRQVAECLERNTPERVGDIARHFLEARLPDRALPYLVASGDQAARAYAVTEAVASYRKALDLILDGQHTALARRAYEGLGNILTFGQRIPEAYANYQQMLAAAEAHEDDSMKVSALNKLAFTKALFMGQFDEAEGFLLEADQLARGNQDKYGINELSLVRCMMCTASADFEGVVRYMDETVSISKELNEDHQMAMGYEHISSSQVYMGLFEQSWKTLQDGLALTRRTKDKAHEAGLLHNAALHHIFTGNLEAAEQAAKESFQIGEKIGAMQTSVVALWALGQTYLLQGDYEKALNTLNQGLALGEPMTDYISWMIVLLHGSLSKAYAETGDTEKAAHHAGLCLAVIEKPLAYLSGGMAYADVGLVHLAAGNTEEAETFFLAGLENASSYTLLETPRLLAGMALAALARGEVDRALEKAGEASAHVCEHALRSKLPITERALARGLSAAGRHAEALEHILAGEVVALEMGLRPELLAIRRDAAAVYEVLGEGSKAAEMQAAAQTVQDEIAGLFSDPGMKSSYLDNMSVKQ